MRNQVYYDEKNGVLREKYIGDALITEAPEYFARVVKLFEGKEHRYSITDLSEAAKVVLGKKAREMIAEEAGKVNYEKIAYIGAHPVLRMIAKALRATKKSLKTETRFCKTEEEALAWLKGEEN